jgi:hypothetical protein
LEAAAPSVVNSGLLILLLLFLVNDQTDAFVRRRALHQYDPADLVTSFNDRIASDGAATKPVTQDGSDDGKSNNVQLRQIEEAMAKGLLVDFSTPLKKTPYTTHMDDEDGVMGSPVSVLSEESRRHDTIMEFGNENDVDLLDGDDSDDELL